MKFLSSVFIVLLVLAGSVSLADYDALNDYQYPYRFQAVLSATEEVHHVRIVLRFYVSKGIPRSKHNTGKCSLRVNGQAVADIEEFLITGSAGPELWLPHLQQGEVVTLSILWDYPYPAINYADFEVENSGSVPVKVSKVYGAKYVNYSKRPNLERVWTLTLDDVCSRYGRERPLTEEKA